MSDTVTLRDTQVSLDSDTGRELILDCCRYAEKILSEGAIRKRYRFSDEDWESLGANTAVLEAIELEKVRRIRDGSAARERAQILFAETPTVLGDILHGDGVSPRHKIESARELRQIAANGPESAAAGTKFEIFIDLSGDGAAHVEHYSKSIAVCPDDPDDITPQNVIAAITAKNKSENGGSGEPL